MAFKKKTWVDRMVEYAGRRKITNATTMAAQIVDVERAEGVVSEEGTAINAVNMNDLEQRTADAFSAVQQDIEGINSDLSALNDSGAIIGMNAREDGVYITYHNGADTVIKKLGSVLYAGFLTPTSYNQNGPGNANFDLKPLLSNYASLTTANMCIEATYFKGFEARVNNLSIQGGTGYTYTYDATTGMLTVSGIGTVNYSYKSRPEKIKLVVLQDDIA